jgi:hypothetical protein
MREKTMKKLWFSGVGIILALIFLSSTGFTWNFATHAYIANHIGKTLPLANFNEIYGTISPDLFNVVFSLMDDQTLYSYTHGLPQPGGENFLKVWKKGKWGLAGPTCYGYVAHNDVWGADFAAHHMAQSVALGKGYVIFLAEILNGQLGQSGLWVQLSQLLGAPVPDEDKMTFCENVVEYAGDLIIKKADPQIGLKIMMSCVLRSPDFPRVLEQVFPAVYPVRAAEKEFRKQMALYGAMLMQNDQNAIIASMAEQLADLTIQYIKATKGIDLSAYSSLFQDICKNAIGGALQLCQGYNYMDEVKATITFVKNGLLAHDVVYRIWLFRRF